MAPAGEDKPGAYDFATIERKWQRYWRDHRTFDTPNPGRPGFDASKPKCYILDMFPYPSGAGLHVGHPIGYCATDIYARYKRMRGFNVLHPMGYDAFGLPAEQYAIETGVHPAVTTKANIQNMSRQLKMFGFSYDWSRELATCEPGFYKFTQWIFVQLFNSWYDRRAEKARPIDELISELERETVAVTGALDITFDLKSDDRVAWASLSADQKRSVIDGQRLAYLAEVPVNWCPELGTVLANEEVTNEGRSERGDHPVYRRPLRQWMLRITAYAERLLSDLDEMGWPESIKIMQRNWIGRSTGAEVDFPIAAGGQDAPTVSDFHAWRRARNGRFPSRPLDSVIRIYTTRPDTLFGATYVVLAPEHPLVERIATPEHHAAVVQYVNIARNRTDLDRTAETKEKTGVFTGAFAINPVNGEHIPVWVADYVLMGYGTGAIMAVPGSDERDFEFAKQFNLPIVTVVEPTEQWAEQIARLPKGTLNDLREAASSAIRGNVNRWRTEDGDARARHVAYAEDYLREHDSDVGLTAADIQRMYVAAPAQFESPFCTEGIAVQSPAGDTKFGDDTCDLNALTTNEAKGKIIDWLERTGLGRGAVNYKLRDWVFSRQKYWGEPFPILHDEDGRTVSLDASELPLTLPDMTDFKPAVSDDPDALPQPPLTRATDWINVERNGRRFIRDANTMPQWAGSCWYYLRFLDPHNQDRFCDPQAERYWMPVDLYVGGAEHAVLHLLYARFWHKVLFDLGYVHTAEPFAKLINQGMVQAFSFRDPSGRLFPSESVEEVGVGQYLHRDTGGPVEQIVAKMSKSLKNVVNPDEIIERHGADTFRLYEMFMGPIESSKPWNTRDVPGLSKLLNRIWRLVIDESTGELSSGLADGEPDESVNRLLHKTIKGVTEDIEQLKYNTAIARMFEFVNQMTPLETRPTRAIEPFVLLLAPFAPHIAEELWQRLGHHESLVDEPWPKFDPALAADDEIEIAVQILGKVKSRVIVAADADEKTLERIALDDPKIKKELTGKTVRKVIVVKGRLVNIVAN